MTITRRAFLGSITAGAVLGTFGNYSFGKQARKTNILFIMSDDHCSQAVGAYGGRLSKLNPTPTIDRLADEGMLFENAFCTNSICSPSRTCILTGQYG